MIAFVPLAVAQRGRLVCRWFSFCDVSCFLYLSLFSALRQMGLDLRLYQRYTSRRLDDEIRDYRQTFETGNGKRSSDRKSIEQKARNEPERDARRPPFAAQFEIKNRRNHRRMAEEQPDCSEKADDPADGSDSASALQPPSYELFAAAGPRRSSIAPWRLPSRSAPTP